VSRAALPMRPEGLAGRLFGKVMERANERAYRRAIEELAPAPGERFVEVGFGTGRLVELLLGAAEGVEVCGVDPTPTMLEVACARRPIARAGGRVDLQLGDAGALPWPDAHFDGALALHSFQFWSDPVAALGELRRALRPGARLVIVLRHHGERAPDWLPNPLSRGGREVEAARALLGDAGFADVAEAAPARSSRVLRARR